MAEQSKQPDTKQKRADKATIEPEFKAFFEQLPGLYMVLDSGLRIVAASDAYLHATKTNRSDMIGRYVFDVFPDNPDDPNADAVANSTASFNRVLKSGVTDAMVVQRHDIRRLESEGGGFETRYWSPVNSPVLRPDGSAAYVIHRVEDVTEFVRLKQAGVEQAKVTDELRERTLQAESDLYSRSREVAETSRKLKQTNDELSQHRERLEEAVENRTAALHAEVVERKRMEAEARRLLASVQEEKDKLSALVNSIQDEVWFADTDKNFALANPSALREFGLATIGHTNVEKMAASLEVYRLDGTPRPVDEAPPLRALEGEVVRNQEEIILTPISGERRHREVNSAPVRDAGGSIVGSVSVVRDITERKQMEEALRESERRYSALFANKINGMAHCRVITDEHGRPVDYWIMQINEAYEQIIGIKRADIEGRKATEVFPDIKHYAFDYIGVYGRIALEDGEIKFEEYFEATGQYLSIYAYSPLPGEFAAIFTDVTDRKRAEETIRESRVKLEAALNSMTDAVFISDADGNFIEFNDASATFHRFRNKDECWKAFSKYSDIFEGFLPNGEPVPPDMWPVMRALRGEIGTNVELNVRRKDTGERWVASYSFSPIRDKDGHIVGSVTVGRDISDRKRTEEEVRKSFDTVRRNEEQLRVLIQNVGSGVALIDEAGKFPLVNRAFLRIFGLDSESDILNINSQDWSRWEVYGEDGKLLHVDDHPVRKAVMTGKPMTSQLVGVRNPGANELTWMLINAEPLLREDGTVYTVVSTYHDITERKRLEEELRKSHDKLEMRVRERTEAVRRQADLLELAHNAIIVRDLESRVTFWNHGAEELYGWTRAESLGNVTRAFLKTRFPVSPDEQMAALTKEDHWEGELEHTTKDGRNITVLSRQAMQRDEAGNPAAVMEINLDITETRRAEEQLRQAQKMEALGTLTGGVAHDFNNILAAIMGFSELIRDHSSTGSREARHAARVLEAALRGRELVRQMLTFSRRTEQERKPLQLSSIVYESVRLLRASIPTTISIRTNVRSESGVILGDPVQIQQILMNLCTNASYAMREKGGSLDIELSDLSVSSSNGDPHGVEPGLYMKLLVRDTGTGIPPDIMDKIFDPFFTTKGVGEGTGLGLSVVLGIVKQSNGYIFAESEPGKGSVFTVYFPKVAGEPSKDMAADQYIPTGSERILFVDDEEALVEMGEELLAELGYEVICSMSSRDALALLQQDASRFDLVITDQTMPEMTGLELAEEILTIRPDMPIIMCTGFSHLVNEESAREAGISAFVMKPLTKREIARTVREVLDR